MSADFQSPDQQGEAARKLLVAVHAKAEKGDAQSQFDLGAAFSLGSLGVAKDEAEAVKWFRKAAEQNHPVAQFSLGISYAYGQGVAKNEVEAVKWWRKAAEQNLADAQFNLGLCYAKGEGVSKDAVEAYKWWRLASAQGNEDAKRAANKAERIMTRKQMAEGQELARSFKPRTW